MTAPGGLGPVTGVPWRPVSALTAAGMLLVSVAAAWPASVVAGTTLVLGVAVLAGATAYVLDEPSAEAVDATPTSLRARTLARLLVAGAVLAAGAAAVTVLALRSGADARLGAMVWLSGCVLVAVASAAALRRRLAEPGDAVAGGLLAVVMALAIVNPVSRWVDLFPSRPGERWAGALVLWGLVGVAGLVVLARATRDPLA